MANEGLSSLWRRGKGRHRHIKPLAKLVFVVERVIDIGWLRSELQALPRVVAHTNITRLWSPLNVNPSKFKHHSPFRL